MKNLFMQYGTVILTAAAVFALYLLFSKNFLFAEFAKADNTDKVSNHYDTFQDKKKTEEIMETAVPTVEKNTADVKAGCRYDLNSLITVKNHLGVEISFEVVSVINPEGLELLTGSQTARDFLFEKTGIYTLAVEATDSNGITVKKGIPYTIKR